MGEEREEGEEEENLREWDGPDGEKTETESKKRDILSKGLYKASKKPDTIYILTW